MKGATSDKCKRQPGVSRYWKRLRRSDISYGDPEGGRIVFISNQGLLKLSTNGGDISEGEGHRRATSEEKATSAVVLLEGAPRGKVVHEGNWFATRISSARSQRSG
jgi:hypothetical protein